MTQVVVEGDLVEKLSGAGGKVELLDRNGRLLGVFDPGASIASLRARSPFTIEELRERIADPNRRPFAEFLAELPES